MSYAENLTGQRFGRLVVIERAPKISGKKPRWICQCDCGNTKEVAAAALKSGGVRSCGCLYYSVRPEAIAKITGEKSHFYKHGLSQSRINRIYRLMKRRCLNKADLAYPKYGGRGIKICDEWLNDFMSFYSWSMENGYSDDLTLDRIDVNGDYSPTNCRWVDMVVQQNNRTNNVKITFAGEEHTIPEWARITGLTRSAIDHRLKRGWSVEEALSLPMHSRRVAS